jgi:hypothetical protein
MMTRRTSRLARKYIAVWRRRCNQRRYANTFCPITLEPISSIDKVFALVSTNMLRRGYDAKVLAEYLRQSRTLRDPETKEKLNSATLMRL